MSKKRERYTCWLTQFVFHDENLYFLEKDMKTITTHKKTDFGDVWYVNADDGSFRFAIYRYDDDSGTVYLSNVFVREESRGKGYGNCILDIVDKVAKGMGGNCDLPNG